jgi:hypothetical protein
MGRRSRRGPRRRPGPGEWAELVPVLVPECYPRRVEDRLARLAKTPLSAMPVVQHYPGMTDRLKFAEVCVPAAKPPHWFTDGHIHMRLGRDNGPPIGGTGRRGAGSG